MERDQIILVLAWILFYFFHSLLASNWAKKYGSKLSLEGRKYRLFYNFISVITFSIAVYLSLITPSMELVVRQAWMKTLGLIFAVWGVWIVNLSFRYYDFRTFAGLREEETTRLQKNGLLKLVRHPIYVGTLFILIGYLFFSPTSTSLTILLVTFVYVFIGIYLEEKKLIREFGAEYIEYKKEVPMLIPFLKF